MRTTLDIADDANSMGMGTLAAPQVSERLATYGIRPLPARGGVISNELIDRLRDAEGV